jgi:hypothetical protein
MDEELDNKLCTQYPKLYAQRGLDMKQTAMCWGFQCGNGWYKLLDTLSHFLTLEIEKGVELEATTVKEKFGTLRFYYYGGNEYTSELINMFERASEHVCEQCGNWSELRGKGWVYNMCTKCWDAFKLERGIKEDKREED